MPNKRKSKVTDEAEARIAALKTIEGKLGFPRNLTMESYIAKATEARVLLAALNASNATTETSRSSFEKTEAELATMSSRVLKAVLAQFGPDSEEYATAGGTRTSARRKAPRLPDEAGPATPSGASTPTA